MSTLAHVGRGEMPPLRVFVAHTSGGVKHSYHLSGNAVDFRVARNSGAVHGYLSSNGSVVIRRRVG
jgi:hypothetical protein